MAYAENRGDALTGQWIGQVRMKDGRKIARPHETRKAAEAWKAYVRMFGQEPPQEGAARAGRSFREVAEACKAAGGPRGTWGAGKDRSVLQRLDYAVGRIGGYDIEDVTRALVREKITDVRR